MEVAMSAQSGGIVHVNERVWWGESFVDGQIVKVLITVRWWWGGKRV